MVILISSLTLNNNKPLSGHSIVTCLIISSKHWEYNSSLTGHIPFSLACLSFIFSSKALNKSLAFSLVAGSGDTY